MKSSSAPLKCALVALGIVLTITLVGFAAESKGYVTFQENAVLIPGTDISPADQKDLNNILKKYDKSLYKIETYEKGRLVKTQGSLSDVILKDTKASQFTTSAKKHAITGWSLQIGLDVNQHMPTPPARSNGSGSSEELVARVTKILSKYARK
jgi:hypothetical protein